MCIRDRPYTRHDIVYSLVDDVASYLSSKLPPDRISKDVARAEVLQLFTLNNGTTVIGCRVVEGTFPASAGVRVSRQGEIIETDARGVRLGEKNGFGLSQRLNPQLTAKTQDDPHKLRRLCRPTGPQRAAMR